MSIFLGIFKNEGHLELNWPIIHKLNISICFQQQYVSFYVYICAESGTLPIYTFLPSIFRSPEYTFWVGPYEDIDRFDF